MKEEQWQGCSLSENLRSNISGFWESCDCLLVITVKQLLSIREGEVTTTQLLTYAARFLP